MNELAPFTLENGKTVRRFNFKWSDEILAKAQELRRKGYSASLIGRELNISRNAVLGKFWRQTNPGGWHPREPYGPREPRQARQPSKPSVKPTLSLQRKPGPKPPPKPTVAALMQLAPLRAFSVSANGTVAKQLGEPATLLERHEAGCCWPINGGGPYLYCNAHRIEEQPYCPAHRSIAYQVRQSR